MQNILVLCRRRKPTKNVKGLISKLHVLLVVDGRHGEFSLRHVPVVLDVVGQEA